MARREDRQRFWTAIAKGLITEDAGTTAGISPAVAARWFRQSGGMPSVSQAPLSGRYLSFLEREEIDALFAAMPTHGAQALRDRVLLLFLYNTGARVQEVADLRIADLDLAPPPRVRPASTTSKKD